ncbi:MAG: hypothetical protein GY905_03345, partial [Gammaproteobacteria bacterium]|nr:hypothetical protein [Gammaproteobacteria bacterium]
PGQYRGGIEYNHDDDALVLWADGNQQVELDSDGNLNAKSGKLMAAGGADITGNIAVTGTVDGRDLATDGTKLDGIDDDANNYVLPSTVVHDNGAGALRTTATAISIAGHTISLYKGDGTFESVTVPDNDTTLNSSLDTADGLSVGYQAGYYLTGSWSTGEFNTYLGPKAGWGNSYGDYNTMVGYKSGFWFGDDGGDGNTAVGAYAMFGSMGDYANGDANGSRNTAIGREAGNIITSGSDNTFVGYQAGESVKTGDDNTIIGSLSGTSTLSETVLIGAGSTERLKVTSDGLFINGSAKRLALDA